MDPRLAGLAQLLTGAPWWVWPLLLVLVAAGVQRLRPSAMPLARLTIVPAVFFSWGLATLAMRAAGRPSIALAWLGAALVGSAIGWSAAPAGIRADREHRRISVPGSWAPLAASVTVFVLKYALAVAIALRPGSRDALALLDIAVSGASAGYFAAGLLHTLNRYRRAPSVDLSASAPEAVQAA